LHHQLKLLLPAAAATPVVAAAGPCGRRDGPGACRPAERGAARVGAAVGPTRIRFQVRVHGTSTWHLTAPCARVGRKGRFSVRGEFTGAGTFDVRFHYVGGAWAPTQSKALVIAVS
jgi:hypothetical protein